MVCHGVKAESMQKGDSCMKDKTKQFRTKLVHEMEKLKSDLGFGDIECGEDEVLATTVIEEMSVSPHPCRLDLVGTDDHTLTAYLRNVTFLGSSSSLVNRVVSYTEDTFVRRAQTKGEKICRNDIELACLLIDVFCSKPRSSDDLMLMCLLAINGKIRRARSAVDFIDGEVVVVADMWCNFEEMPSDVEETIKAVSGHGFLIQELERTLGKFAFADPKPSQRLVSMLFDRIDRRIGSNEKSEKASAEDVLTI